MASSLSNLVNNLSEEIQRIKCNVETMIKYMKLAELNISIVNVFFNTQILRKI